MYFLWALNPHKGILNGLVINKRKKNQVIKQMHDVEEHRVELVHDEL